MSDKIHGFLPATSEPPTDRQRLFLRYFTGILIDLVVLNLFAEYWGDVHVSSFTISLLAAILLQVLLKATIWVESSVISQDMPERPAGGRRWRSSNAEQSLPTLTYFGEPTTGAGIARRSRAR